MELGSNPIKLPMRYLFIFVIEMLHMNHIEKQKELQLDLEDGDEIDAFVDQIAGFSHRH